MAGMTIEIPPARWAQFCDKLNESQLGTMMDIRLEAGGDLRLVAQSVPLQAAVFVETRDACNSIILIEFGLPDERPVQHSVVDPARIILRKQSDSDRYNLLEMVAENGMTVIIFHPGINRKVLNDLQIAA